MLSPSCRKRISRLVTAVLCGFSRRLNFVLTGRWECVCTSAYTRDWQGLERRLDRFMVWRDREAHCRKSAAQDAVHGVYDGSGFGLDCRDLSFAALASKR